MTLHLLSVPKDLLRLLFDRCSAKTLYSFSLTCKEVARVILDEKYLQGSKKRLLRVTDESRVECDCDEERFYHREVHWKLPNGDGTELTQDGDRLTLEQFSHGNHHGVSATWCKDENDAWWLSDIESYANDRPHGIFERWGYQDNVKVLLRRSEYQNGKQHGILENWDVFYPEDDDDVGVYVQTARCNFAHGVKHGLCETWHPNGNRKYRGYWECGKKVGVHEEWAEDGMLLV